MSMISKRIRPNTFVRRPQENVYLEKAPSSKTPSGLNQGIILSKARKSFKCDEQRTFERLIENVHFLL